MSPGLSLAISCIRDEFDQLSVRVSQAADALERDANSVTVKLSLEQIEKHAAHIAALAGAHAARLTDHINRNVRAA